MKLIKQLSIRPRFFYLLSACVGLLVLCLVLPKLFLLAQIISASLAILLFIDILLLFTLSQAPLVVRKVSENINLDGNNEVVLELYYPKGLAIYIRVFDQLPVQFQEREAFFPDYIQEGGKHRYTYSIHPFVKGDHLFGQVTVLCRTALGLAEKRVQAGKEQTVYCIPNIQQMREMELYAMASKDLSYGIKRTRKMGNSYEFEQIKQYVAGDDIRSINWKATGRRNEIMVNQYQDERAQHIYNVIDKGRSMHAPFEGMSLVDHAVNSALALSNVIIKKHDKAGYFSFAKKLGGSIRADSQTGQLRKILQLLAREKEMQEESNFELLYHAVKNVAQARSCIFLYTNFPSTFAFEKALPLLKKINKLHLLVVIVFQNTELKKVAYTENPLNGDRVQQTVARTIYMDQRAMVMKIRQAGIQTLFTAPDKVTVSTLNKYLELKSNRRI